MRKNAERTVKISEDKCHLARHIHISVPHLDKRICLQHIHLVNHQQDTEQNSRQYEPLFHSGFRESLLRNEENKDKEQRVYQILDGRHEYKEYEQSDNLRKSYLRNLLDLGKPSQLGS